MSTKPWDIHPDLTEERLQVLARLIREVRGKALLLHEPAEGDSNWGLGCRAHERTCYAIKQAAENNSWLKVIEGSLHFVFQIGKVPIRFYRGEADNPSPRSLRRNYPEIEANQGSLPFASVELDWFWRLAIETDISGEVYRVVMVQVAEGGDTKNPWPIPFEAPVIPLVPIVPLRQEGIVLPPPEVMPLIQEKPASGEDKAAGDLNNEG